MTRKRAAHTTAVESHQVARQSQAVLLWDAGLTGITKASRYPVHVGAAVDQALQLVDTALEAGATLHRQAELGTALGQRRHHVNGDWFFPQDVGTGQRLIHRKLSLIGPRVLGRKPRTPG